ncbi:unnamed protein product, partial [Pylaiella littoralis]
MLALWAAWMVYRISSWGRLLRKLPYVPTRFHQLSYRFFGVQAVFVGVVYAVLALARLAKIHHYYDLLGGSSVTASELMLLFAVKGREDHVRMVWMLCAFVL